MTATDSPTYNLPCLGLAVRPGPGRRTPAICRDAELLGRDAPHGEWFYGFHLAIKTGQDLASRIMRPWSIVPAAVNERDVAADVLEAGLPPSDLLCDKGFNGAAFAAEQAARGTAVLLPPTRGERCSMPWMLPKVIAGWRNPVEASFGEITDRIKLAQRGACLTRIDQLT